MDRDTSTTTPSLALRSSNVVAYVLLIVVNVLVNTGLIGPTNAEVSGKFPTPLTPAGWAFSIWGLIFGLQGVGTVYQALPYGYNSEGTKQRIVNAIGLGWQLGWYCEMGWQLCFMLETPGGMFLSAILLVLATLAFGSSLLGLYRLKERNGSLSSPFLYAAFFAPTSINTAWLSVATSVGILVVPVSYQTTFNLDIPATILAAIVTCLGVTAMQRARDSAYGLTLIWSLVAVYGSQPESKAVQAASLACIVVTCLFTILSVLRRRSPREVEQASADIRQPLTTGRSSSVH
ncbi:hypothetical protein WJX84_007536 [Apatococcus fuscideae]|uniref:Tryptophan-rich sensory protein n=1 Tax=Apatococcus fuscideae TaxID=2026836 RepID=A0AAW1TBA6_9CHLO